MSPMLISSLRRPRTPAQDSVHSVQADNPVALSGVSRDTTEFPWDRVDALPNPESPLPLLDPLDDDEYGGAPPLTQP